LARAMSLTGISNQLTGLACEGIRFLLLNAES
jgi:hypothetical protein